MDDVRLLERMCRGDEQAFACLYERHQRSIYRYAAQMCGSAAADDVVQDTFLTLLRQPDRYDATRGTVTAYLFGIARHHVFRRLSVLAPEQALDDDDDDDAACIAADASSPLEHVSRAEIIERVRIEIGSLPPRYRDAIVLCALQDMDYATAAAVMACPIGTVRSRLHRAKAMLMARLAPFSLAHR